MFIYTVFLAVQNVAAGRAASNNRAGCRDAVQQLAWDYFVHGASSADILLQRMQSCVAQYQRAASDAEPLSVRKVLGWIAGCDELKDCVLQEVPVAEFRLRVAQFKEACMSGGWVAAPPVLSADHVTGNSGRMYACFSVGISQVSVSH